jgi:hypothetical protein
MSYTELILSMSDLSVGAWRCGKQRRNIETGRLARITGDGLLLGSSAVTGYTEN